MSADKRLRDDRVVADGYERARKAWPTKLKKTAPPPRPWWRRVFMTLFSVGDVPRDRGDGPPPDALYLAYKRPSR